LLYLLEIKVYPGVLTIAGELSNIKEFASKVVPIIRPVEVILLTPDKLPASSTINCESLINLPDVVSNRAKLLFRALVGPTTTFGGGSPVAP
jgi:hypothetical protein